MAAPWERRSGFPSTLNRVLITGGSGLLALGWACALRSSHEVVLGTHLHRVRLRGTVVEPVDLESEHGFAAALERHRPDVVVHTVGLANVDECECDLERARHVNVELAENVARAVRRAGIRLVHISTDHLFAGDRPLRTETEPPHPLNTYARTKAMSEERVLEANPDALVVRTNFFGWGPRNRRSFSDWILDHLRADRAITLFEDVFFTPILIEALARNAHELLGQGNNGVMNIVGDERISKYEFGRRLAERFSLNIDLLRRGSVAGAKLTAPRPADMSLDNALARKRLGRKLGTVDDFLNVLKQQETSGLMREIHEATME